jgi:hypothetical protein
VCVCVCVCVCVRNLFTVNQKLIVNVNEHLSVFNLMCKHTDSNSPATSYIAWAILISNSFQLLYFLMFCFNIIQ